MRKITKKSAVKPSPERKEVPVITSLQNVPQKDLNAKIRDPRLPMPDSVLSKTYRGKTIEVKVLEKGFEYQGKVYKSISRVAMEIVQRPISGYVFFGLK